jgi:hypothetical protein
VGSDAFGERAAVDAGEREGEQADECGYDEAFGGVAEIEDEPRVVPTATAASTTGTCQRVTTLTLARCEDSS